MTPDCPTPQELENKLRRAKADYERVRQAHEDALRAFWLEQEIEMTKRATVDLEQRFGKVAHD